MARFVGAVRWSGTYDSGPGPDGAFRSGLGATATERSGRVSLGSCRAALTQTIVTREDGWERQPLADGPLLSMFDGRLDDRDGLAQRLGLSLGRMPDGAVALAAFRRWGADAPLHMLGEFAWAVWDEERQRLMLASDTSFSRSLYYWRGREAAAFATALPAMFALPEVPREIDEEGLADFLVLNPETGDRTPYQDVRRVMPGETVLLTRDSERRMANWDFNSMPGPPREPLACAEAARDLFETAVRARLRGPGPVAICVSGGLDSSAIAAVAARASAPGPVQGFALVPPVGVELGHRAHELPDGRPQLAALASAYSNLRLTHIEPPNDLVDRDPTALFHATALPVSFAPGLGWQLAAWRAAAKAGARLVMTGDMGEASLTYHGNLGAMVGQGDVPHALAQVLALGCRGGGYPRLLDEALLGGRLAAAIDTRRGANVAGGWELYSPIHPDLAARTRVRERLLEAGFPRGVLHRRAGGADVLRRTLRWSALPMDCLAALRRLSGMEHTDPFADRRILAFCLALPETAFIREGMRRWLGRAAFRGLLPPAIVDEPRKAAQNPEWFHRLTQRRDDMMLLLERAETSPLAARALDLPRLRRLAERWPATAAEAAALGPAIRFTLVRGLHAGAFLRWLDPSNAPGEQDGAPTDSRDPP